MGSAAANASGGLLQIMDAGRLVSTVLEVGALEVGADVLSVRLCSANLSMQSDLSRSHCHVWVVHRVSSVTSVLPIF